MDNINIFNAIVSAIPTVGFPIIMALLLWFEQYRFNNQIIATLSKQTTLLETIASRLFKAP